MRIIGGTHKGRRLSTPRWEGLRPTSDRLRETLFDILGPCVEGARVLDGCAGTGAVGLEALSRGAAHAVFVDRDPRAVALIRRNAEACGLADRCTVRRAALPADFRRLAPGAFDLMLLDPPYGAADIGPMLAAAAARLGPDRRLLEGRPRRLKTPRPPRRPPPPPGLPPPRPPPPPPPRAAGGPAPPGPPRGPPAS
ncbi:MAG: 16S rRNA (guanine(966)-N(2))-methyltransferase RsmD, partial [Acidobacteria bacterium]|nr:16S rRNA (guanine(966)-N(2))-methyltransferase RsmD [Acidobacteriota bacterium]